MPTYDVEITRYKNTPQFANLKITAPTEAEAEMQALSLWNDDTVTWIDYGEPDYVRNDILVLGEAK